MGSGGGGTIRTSKSKEKPWQSLKNYKIHKGRQDKHIEGSKNYKQQIANGKNPSILTEDASKLLVEARRRSGFGSGNKQTFDFDRAIGKFYDIKSGNYFETTRGTIHLDSKGNAHIVPSIPLWLLELRRYN